MSRAFVALAVVSAVIPLASLQAQTIDDALRHSEHNTQHSARMGALGLSYLGIADDYAAVYANPAGLTLLPSTEFTAGLQVLANRARTSYLGSSRDWSNGSPLLVNAGVVFPIRNGGTTFAFALGFGRESDFSQADSLWGFNPSSSIIQSWVRNQNSLDLRGNRAFRLALADTLGGRFFSPITGNVSQGALTRQGGGMNNITIGGAVDLGSVVSVGASIIGSFGTYTYDRDYQEFDDFNRYDRLDTRNFTNIDFERLLVRESIRQDIGGIRAVIGLQGRFGNNIRASLVCTTPGVYSIREEYQWDGEARFEQGTVRSQTYTESGASAEYSATTPLVVSGGASVHVDDTMLDGFLQGLTISASAEYLNGAQTSLSSNDRASQPVVNAANSIAQRVLVSQIRWGIGAEYEIPATSVVARASLTQMPSPYNLSNTALQTATNVIGLGVGVYLAVNSRLDGMFRINERSLTVNVDNATATQVTNTTMQFALQYVYRF